MCCFSFLTMDTTKALKPRTTSVVGLVEYVSKRFLKKTVLLFTKRKKCLLLNWKASKEEHDCYYFSGFTCYCGCLLAFFIRQEGRGESPSSKGFRRTQLSEEGTTPLKKQQRLAFSSWRRLQEEDARRRHAGSSEGCSSRAAKKRIKAHASLLYRR